MRREFIFLLSVVILLTAAVGVLTGYIVFRERGSAPGSAVGLTAPIEEGLPELPPQGLQLAEGWKCMCGTCTDDLLECHCDDPNGAHEIKAVMRDYFAAGLDEEAVRDEMIKRYGAGILGSQIRPPGPPAGGEGAAATAQPEAAGG